MFRTGMVKKPTPSLSFEKKPERISISGDTKKQLMKTDCLMKNRDFGNKFTKRQHKVETIEACYENCKNMTG